MSRFALLAGLAVLAAGAVAARAEPAALTAAADPQRPTPPLTYQSPFTGYRGFQVLPREGWPEINRRVEAIGGQAGALRGDNAAPSQVPGPGGHEHNKL